MLVILHVEQGVWCWVYEDEIFGLHVLGRLWMIE